MLINKTYAGQRPAYPGTDSSSISNIITISNQQIAASRQFFSISQMLTQCNADGNSCWFQYFSKKFQHRNNKYSLKTQKERDKEQQKKKKKSISSKTITNTNKLLEGAAKDKNKIIKQNKCSQKP